MGLVITDVGKARFAALNAANPPTAPYISKLKVGTLDNVADVLDARTSDTTLQAPPANIRDLDTAIQMTAASAARVLRNVRIVGPDAYDGHEIGFIEVQGGAENLIMYWANAGTVLFQKAANAQVLATAGYEYVDGDSEPTPVVSEITVAESSLATLEAAGIVTLADLADIVNAVTGKVPTADAVNGAISQLAPTIPDATTSVKGKVQILSAFYGSSTSRITNAIQGASLKFRATNAETVKAMIETCLLYTSPSPRDS